MVKHRAQLPRTRESRMSTAAGDISKASPISLAGEPFVIPHHDGHEGARHFIPGLPRRS